MTLSERQHLAAAARGDAQCDLLVRGARIVNVYSGEILPGNIAVAGGRIAYVGPNARPAARELDAAGCYVAPGFVEPHAHPWLLYNPASMAEAILPRGTTTVFNDNLAFFLHGAGERFPELVAALRALPVRCRWLARVTAQSPYPGEEMDFAPEKILPLLELAEVAGTAEMTRWPLAMRGDEAALAIIGRALALGKRADGHTAGAGYEKLAAVAAAGISACHEAITGAEAIDRLRLGYWTMLRHSSLRPDLPELARAVVEHGVDTRRLLVTMDAPSPRFIAEGGFLDEALRRLVEAGVPPVAALQMVTVNPAAYYGLDSEIGGIAPGRAADLVFLEDLQSFRPVRVLAGGRDAREIPPPHIDWSALGLDVRFGRAVSCRPAPGPLPVIEFVSNAITRGAGFSEPAEDLLMAALLDRGGRWAAYALVRNFAPGLAALATTYNTAGQLLVLGRDPAAMERAADAVRRMRGGFAFASSAGVEWEWPLRIAGLMSEEPFEAVVQAQCAIEQRMREAGFAFADVFYALLFLACDFLPGWRLTGRGVLDVRSGKVISPAVAC